MKKHLGVFFTSLFLSMILLPGVQAASPRISGGLDPRTPHKEARGFNKRAGSLNVYARAQRHEALIQEMVDKWNLDPVHGTGTLRPGCRISYYRLQEIDEVKYYWKELGPKFAAEYGNRDERWKTQANIRHEDIVPFLSKTFGRNIFQNYYAEKQKRAQLEIDLEQKKLFNAEQLKFQKASLHERFVFWSSIFNLTRSSIKELFLTRQFGTFLVSACCTILIVRYAVKPFFEHVWRKVFQPAPKIIKQTTLPLTWWQRIFGTGKRPKSRWNELEYDDDLMIFFQKEMEQDRKVTANALPLGFENIILEGPPGTGKTALAENYALEAGMDYVAIPGAAWGADGYY